MWLAFSPSSVPPVWSCCNPDALLRGAFFHLPFFHPSLRIQAKKFFKKIYFFPLEVRFFHPIYMVERQ
jgi:hypothetical protein